MEIYREKINYLLDWKERKEFKPILVLGSRQVGKTYLVKEIFAEKYFKDKYIYVNFMEDQVIKNRLKDTTNPKNIIAELSVYYKTKIEPDWLIIFDEIQELPNIRISFKGFNESYKNVYKIIGLGSYVANMLIDDKVGYPVGQTETLIINPVSYKEYLFTIGFDWIFKDIEDKITNLLKSPIDSFSSERFSYHNGLIDEIKNYLLVGGLPEVLKEYIGSKDFLTAKDKRIEIYSNYVNDINKYLTYNKSHQIKAKLLYENIVNFFVKQNNTFILSNIDKNARIRDYKIPLKLLMITSLVYKVNNLLNPNANYINSNISESEFKLFYNDIGIINNTRNIFYKDFWESTGIDSNIKGSLGENFVLSELANKMLKTDNNIDTLVSYYRFNSNNKYYDIDFLILDDCNNLIPIEVKTTDKTFSKSSLNLYIKKYKPKYAIVFSFKEFNKYKQDDTIVFNLPMYAISFLKFNHGMLKNLLDINDF